MRVAVVAVDVGLYTLLAVFFAGRQQPLSPDSHGYLYSAAQVSSFVAGRPFDHSLFAWRAPFYPLLLALLGNWGIVPVIVLQLAAYFAAAIYAAHTLAGQEFVRARYRPWAFGLSALSLTLIPHWVLKLNLAIRPDGLCVSLLLMMTSQIIRGRRWLALFLAICAALARPELFIVALLLAAGDVGSSPRARAVMSLLVLVPLLLLCTNNYLTSGFFGPSAYVGFNLANHTGAWVDRYTNESYSDVLAAWRTVVQQAGTYINIWPALANRLGADWLQFSTKTLKDLALAMIRAHPGLFLLSVGDSIVGYAFPALKNLTLSNLLVSALFGVYLSASAFITRGKGRYALVLVVCPLAHMIASSFANHAGNLRYRMVFEPVHILAVLLTLAWLVARVQERPSEGGQDSPTARPRAGRPA